MLCTLITEIVFVLIFAEKHHIILSMTFYMYFSKLQELKDQNDELTVELEQVKLQGAPSRKMLEPSSPERGTHPPAREGSVMSHYVRPVVVKRALGSPYGKI